MICGYCDEGCKECTFTEDCFLCLCKDKYETNITCKRCEHDLLYCTCTDEEKQKEVDELLESLKCQK